MVRDRTRDKQYAETGGWHWDCASIPEQIFVLYHSSDLYSLALLNTPTPNKPTACEHTAATLKQYGNFLSCLWELPRTFWLLGTEVDHRGEIKDQTKANKKEGVCLAHSLRVPPSHVVHTWGAPYLLPHRHAQRFVSKMSLEPVRLADTINHCPLFPLPSFLSLLIFIH